MSFYVPADNADMVNEALSDMGFLIELGFTRICGLTPEVHALRGDDTVVKIQFEGENFLIDAIDYNEGFYGQTNFHVLDELAKRLKRDKQDS